MTKLIVYILSLFLSGVIFFYLAILWYKIKKRYYEKKELKLKPKIEEIVKEYINCSNSICHGGNCIRSSIELENYCVEQKNIALKKLKLLARKDIERNILEAVILSHDETKNKVTAEFIATLAEELGLVNYYTKMLLDKDHHKVAEAAEKLGQFRSKLPITQLLNVLKSGNTYESYNSLLALAKIGDEEAFIEGFNHSESIEYLTHRSLIDIIDSFEGDILKVYSKMVKSDNSYIASLFIKSASNLITYDKSLLNNETIKIIEETIVSNLKSDNAELRISSIKFLGAMKESRYIDQIAHCLKDESWEVRAIAAKVLGNFNEDTGSYLITALTDRVWTVRYNAAYSLINSKEYEKYIGMILSDEDRFAKDIIIAVLDNTKKISEIKDKNILDKIKNYTNVLKEA